jgi:Transmembrane domain of unknown function (DUF3566)
VSSTKRTPAEPDRGSVATGQHTPEHNGEGSAGNGRAGDAVAEPAAAGTEPATPEEGTAVTGADIVASEAPASEGDEPRTTDATATTRLRVPTPSGSTPSGSTQSGSTPSKDGKDPEPATDSTPAAPTLDPVSAVPAPGPAAAQPPPWRRMPGHDNREAPVASSADNLLDEGPTAFLEAPGFIPPPARESSGNSAASKTGGWARATRTRPPRQAALQLRRLDPWSVLKLALVLAVVLFFIWLVAVGVLYGVLDGMGVWDRLNGTYADLVSGEAQTGSTLISAGRVFGLAAVIGAINSLLFAVAVTVGAFVYNVSADLVGGIEVTLSERD